MGLKARYITGPKRHPDVGARCGAGGDDDAIAPREYPAEPSVRTLLDGPDGDPHRIDPVEVLGAHRAGKRIDAARDEGGVVDREGELRRPGPLPVRETGGDEQER